MTAANPGGSPSDDDVVTFKNDAGELLEDLYRNNEAVTGLAYSAGIPSQQLELNGTTARAIQSLISEAEKRRRFPRLLQTVNKDYGNDRATRSTA